jgi:hypothetical protein
VLPKLWLVAAAVVEGAAAAVAEDVWAVAAVVTAVECHGRLR